MINVLNSLCAFAKSQLSGIRGFYLLKVCFCHNFHGDNSFLIRELLTGINACLIHYKKHLQRIASESEYKESGNTQRLITLGEAREKIKSSVDKILHLIFTNWEDPFDAIVNEVRTIFLTLLDLSDTCVKVFGEEDKDEKPHYGTRFLKRLADELIGLDWRVKVSHFC